MESMFVIFAKEVLFLIVVDDAVSNGDVNSDDKTNDDDDDDNETNDDDNDNNDNYSRSCNTYPVKTPPQLLTYPKATLISQLIVSLTQALSVIVPLDYCSQ